MSNSLSGSILGPRTIMRDATHLSRATLKAEARDWRRARQTSGEPVAHGAALEYVARCHGFRDWNTACAVLPPEVPTALGPLLPKDRVAGTYLGQPFTGVLTDVRALPDKRKQVTIVFDEPVNVTPSLSFAHLRRRLSAAVDVDGLTSERTSNGEPQLRLHRSRP